MPSYVFACQSCHGTFALSLSLRERESTKRACPHCGSAQVQQLVSNFTVKTAKKS
jgi:putative FmdB family regulatory protein